MLFNKIMLAVFVLIILGSFVIFLVLCCIGFMYPSVYDSTIFKVAVGGFLIPIIPSVVLTTHI